MAGDRGGCADRSAGRHTRIGPPDGLRGLTAALLEWAGERGLSWDATKTDRLERWACRLEVYKSDPAEQPDPSGWETELAFKLADRGAPEA